MRKILIPILLLIFGVQAYSQTGPKILYAVGPDRYPPTAWAVGAKGDVEVLVNIDPDGKVTSVEKISGHPLLGQISKEAASQWKFDKTSSTDGLRQVILTFSFAGGGDADADGQIEIEQSEKKREEIKIVTFPEPYHVDLRSSWLVPKLLLLPRVDGKIKPAYCELHKELMEVEILDIGYGLVGRSGSWDEYDRAQEEIFPNANDSYEGGCQIELTKKIEVHYCKTCRAKKAEWMKQGS